MGTGEQAVLDALRRCAEAKLPSVADIRPGGAIALFQISAVGERRIVIVGAAVGIEGVSKRVIPSAGKRGLGLQPELFPERFGIGERRSNPICFSEAIVVQVNDLRCRAGDGIGILLAGPVFFVKRKIPRYSS